METRVSKGRTAESYWITHRRHSKLKLMFLTRMDWRDLCVHFLFFCAARKKEGEAESRYPEICFPQKHEVCHCWLRKEKKRRIEKKREFLAAIHITSRVCGVFSVSSETVWLKTTHRVGHQSCVNICVYTLVRMKNNTSFSLSENTSTLVNTRLFLFLLFLSKKYYD